jgi:hypothetical protein
MFLGGYWTYLHFPALKKEPVKTPGKRGKTVPKTQAMKIPPDDKVGESAPSWHTALSRKSKKLVAKLKLRIPWRHEREIDAENGEQSGGDKGKEKDP